MPSDQDTQVDELQLEVIPESEPVEDTQNTKEGLKGEIESEDINLNLEEEVKVDKPTPQEENARKQEEAWLTKVTTGKAQVEDAPKWLQSKLNARLEATNKLPETEEVVKQVLAKEREEQEFKTLQGQIPKLTALQAKELQEKFAEYKPLGKTKALRTALDVMGLSQKVKDAEARGVAKGRTSLPRSGQPAVRKSDQVVGGVPLDVIGDDKKWNEMIRQGSVGE